MDYPYIRAWGNLLGKMPRDTIAVVNTARADGAPENATWKTDNGEWKTTSGLSYATKEILDKMASRWA